MDALSSRETGAPIDYFEATTMRKAIQPIETVSQAPGIDVADKAALRGGGNQS